jgi:putative transcriptional regulator
MRQQDFDELIKSVRGAGKIKRGEMAASRTFRFQPDDIRAIRSKLGLSQSEFALLIGVSVATLQNWEQGRRHPEGPARALLRIAAKNPEAVLEALGS